METWRDVGTVSAQSQDFEDRLTRIAKERKRRSAHGRGDSKSENRNLLVSESSKAVFLSYASQDAQAAQRICEALRAAGIEVWFDQSELRGGDAWDHHIRRQIRDCALFVPIISEHTQARPEGYFRLEWRLAEERTHLMGRARAFIVPVCVDRTSERDADVPDSFESVQWTRLPGGETAASFCQRISALLGTEVTTEQPQTSLKPPPSVGRERKSHRWIVAAAVGVVVALLVGWQVWRVVQPKVSPWTPAAVTSAVVMAPEKSIAVLPFLDMSEKHDQEYFSDGLSEELIDLLTKIPALRVPARTSSFYFKGKPDDIATIAARLHVAHVLEGSVRRSGNRLRVTAQLIRADNGYHVWSETYDRKWDDVFKVQDEIAAAVVKALAVSLLGSPLPQIAKASNSEAYALYLQGRSVLRAANSPDDAKRSIELLEQAAKLDSGYAPAWALLSRARVGVYGNYKVGSFQIVREEALLEAHRAITLDPASAEGHLAVGRVLMDMDWNWAAAEHEMQTALRLDSRNADVLRNASFLSAALGRFEEMVLRARAATERDPLNYNNFHWLGQGQFYSGNLAEALASYRKSLALNPSAEWAHAVIAKTLRALGRPAAALTEIERESNPEIRAYIVPSVLDALDRTPEADRARANAERMYGEQFPYRIGQMFAAHKDLVKAFAWWNRAFQQHDNELMYLKGAPAETSMPQLAADPRYKALLRKMNLPEP